MLTGRTSCSQTQRICTLILSKLLAFNSVLFFGFCLSLNESYWGAWVFLFVISIWQQSKWPKFQDAENHNTLVEIYLWFGVWTATNFHHEQQFSMNIQVVCFSRKHVLSSCRDLPLQLVVVTSWYLAWFCVPSLFLCSPCSMLLTQERSVSSLKTLPFLPDALWDKVRWWLSVWSFELTDGRCICSDFSFVEPVEITKELPCLFSHVMLKAVTRNALCFLDSNDEKSAAGLDGLYWVVILPLFHLKTRDHLNSVDRP